MVIRLERMRTSIAWWRHVPFSLVILLLLAFGSLVVNPLLKLDPTTTNIAHQYAEPSKQHLLGTDGAGRDVFARVMAAAQVDLGIAFAASLASVIVGTLLGAIAGYAGGRWERVLLHVFDIWQAIPGMLLGLLTLAVTGPGIVPLISVIAVINIPVYARMVRSEMAPLRHAPLVEAARLSHVSEAKILLVYLLPRTLTSAIAYLPVQAGFSVAMAAGFGFIGLGVKPPAAEWGAMISEGIADMLFFGAWWIPLAPGAMLALTVFLFYRVGHWLAKKVGNGVGGAV